jgi:hypothetical protein
MSDTDDVATTIWRDDGGGTGGGDPGRQLDTQANYVRLFHDVSPGLYLLLPVDVPPPTPIAERRGGERKGSGRHRGDYELSDDDLRDKVRRYVEKCAEDSLRPSLRGLASSISMSASWTKQRLARAEIQLPSYIPKLLAASLLLMSMVAIDAADGRTDNRIDVAGVAAHLCHHASHPPMYVFSNHALK